MPKAQAKKHKLDYSETNKKHLYIKGHVNRVKLQSTEWEKIFVNHISNKGLTSRKCKEFLQLNNT